MIHAVLDSGVLGTGSLDGDGLPNRILRRWGRNEFALIVSEPIRQELERIYRRPYFRRRLTDAQMAAAFARLRKAATWVEAPPLPRPVAAHAADDLVLSTAEAGRADYLVTGDAELWRLGAYLETRIVTPREFLAVLDARQLPPDAT